MTLKLQLSDDEARLLASHLERHLRRLEAELVHTDRRDLRHALAAEIAELRAVAGRVSPTVLASAEPQSPGAFEKSDGDPPYREDLAGT